MWYAVCGCIILYLPQDGCNPQGLHVRAKNQVVCSSCKQTIAYRSDIFGASPEAWLSMSVFTADVCITSVVLSEFREFIYCYYFLLYWSHCDATPFYRLEGKHAWAACSLAGARIRCIDCVLPP